MVESVFIDVSRSPRILLRGRRALRFHLAYRERADHLLAGIGTAIADHHATALPERRLNPIADAVHRKEKMEIGIDVQTTRREKSGSRQHVFPERRIERSVRRKPAQARGEGIESGFFVPEENLAVEVLTTAEDDAAGNDQRDDETVSRGSKGRDRRSPAEESRRSDRQTGKGRHHL